MTLPRTLLAWLTACLVLTACNDSQTDDTAPATSSVPAVSQTATTASPTAGSDSAPTGDPAAGKAEYASSCAGCHGAAGAGGLGPAMAESAAWDHPTFVAAIREGLAPQGELKSSMPRYTVGQLSDSGINDIHSYLRSLN